MRLFQIYFLLLTLLGLGCRKPEELPTYYVSEELKRYCWFPDGSYWIYEQEGAPGVFDTVTYSNRISKVEVDDFNSYNQEILGITLVVAGRYSRHTIMVQPLDERGEHQLSKLMESYSTSSAEQYDYLLFENSNGKDTLGIYPNPSKIFHDSIQVSGATYANAIEVRIDPAVAADWTYNVVWVRDVGIVRRSTKDGFTWNLVEYEIQ